MREIHDAPVPHESGGHSSGLACQHCDCARSEIATLTARAEGLEWSQRLAHEALDDAGVAAGESLPGRVRMLRHRAEEAERKEKETMASLSATYDDLRDAEGEYDEIARHVWRSDRASVADQIVEELKRRDAERDALQGEVERLRGEHECLRVAMESTTAAWPSCGHVARTGAYQSCPYCTCARYRRERDAALAEASRLREAVEELREIASRTGDHYAIPSSTVIKITTAALSPAPGEPIGITPSGETFTAEDLERAEIVPIAPEPVEAAPAWPSFDSRFLRREPGAECSQATVDVHSYLRTHPAFAGRVWAAHLRDRATGEDHVVALVDLTREVASSKWSLEDVREFPTTLAARAEEAEREMRIAQGLTAGYLRERNDARASLERVTGERGALCGAIVRIADALGLVSHDDSDDPIGPEANALEVVDAICLRGRAIRAEASRLRGAVEEAYRTCRCVRDTERECDVCRRLTAALSPAPAAVDERERAARIAETHPLHPSTHTGERQRWLREGIAAAIRGASLAPAGEGEVCNAAHPWNFDIRCTRPGGHRGACRVEGYGIGWVGGVGPTPAPAKGGGA